MFCVEFAQTHFARARRVPSSESAIPISNEDDNDHDIDGVDEAGVGVGDYDATAAVVLC